MATDQRRRSVSLAVTVVVLLSVATVGVAAFTEPADASSVSVWWQDEPPETVAEGNNVEVRAGISVSEQSEACLVDSDTVVDDQLVCKDVYSWDDSVSFSVSASKIRDADFGSTAELKVKVSHTHEGWLGETHSDSTGEVSTTYEQTGDFTLTVEDGSGSEFSGATVDFYDDNWNTIGTKTTDYNGEVTWYNQIEGSYHVEVSNGDEYWGTYGYELNGDSTSKTFQRQAPYITSTSTSGDGKYKQNEGFELSADVKNDAPADKEVEVKFYIDGTLERTVPSTISADSSEMVERTFAVDDPGSHEYEIEVATIYNGAWMTTDTGVSGSFSINEQPTASRENPSDSEITVDRGDSETFELDASDGDGGLSTADWDTPNGFSQDSIYGSDATPEKTVSFSSTGTYTVEGSVSDEESATSNWVEWTVNVVKPTGNIEATVVENGQTVSGATVILLGEDRSKTTGDDGTVTFEDVEEGIYNLAYHVNDQHRGGGQVSVSDGTATIELNRVAPMMTGLSVDDENGNADGEFELGDPTTVSPTVYNDESASHPVTTVISVRGPNGDFARATNGERLDGVTREQTLGSDSYGYFGVDVDPEQSGEYDLKVVTKTDYGNGPVKTGETDWRSAFSVPEAKISGKVTADSTGNGVGDAAIYLDGSRAATTDAGGSYSVSVDSVGTYDLRVEADGFETTRQTVDVSRGDVIEDVALHGKPQGVFFEVSKATSLDGYEFDGEPVVGATVEIDGETYTTDSEGSVDISLDPGTYEYTVSVPDYETASDDVTVYPNSANAVSVPLVKDNVGIIELDVVDAAGTGIGANLYRVLVDGETVEPNTEGELLLEEGTRTIRVEPTDFGRTEGVQPIEKDVDVVAGARKQVTFKPTSVELTVSFENANRGTVTVDGHTLSQSGTVTVSRGETVTVSASPASGYSFDHWLGTGDADRESQSISLPVDGSREVTPLFTRGQDIGIDISRSETVTGSPVSLKADVPSGMSVSKYKWTTASVPDGDDGVPAFPHHNNAEVTSFRPEAPGEYELSLTVTTESGAEKTSFVTLTVDERSDLINRFAPIVEYHPAEEYKPTRVEAYVRNTDLSWNQGTEENPTLWDLADAPPSSRMMLDGGQSVAPGYDNAYPRTVYTSLHPSVSYDGEQYTAVTYWLFYVYDPKGGAFAELVSDHPSDLETVTILLQNGNPELVAASQHFGGERREWEKVKHRGTHLRLFPAEGGHSSYLHNESKYDGRGTIIQDQFIRGRLNIAEESMSTAPYLTDLSTALVADESGGGVVMSHDGSIGKSYEIAVLTGKEPWLDYPGTFTESKGKTPAQRERWTNPGEYVADLPVDERQRDATILNTEINDDGTVSVNAENTGPKPHTFHVTVAAKPSSASWSSSEVEQIRDMPMPLGTRHQKTMRTPSSLVPADRSEPWDVRVTLRGYDSQVAEAEDTFDTLVTSTAAEEQMNITWTASPTTGGKIDVEATVDHAEDGVESIDVVWDTGVLNIGGSSSSMDRVDGTTFEKTIPTNDVFEYGEDVQVKIEVTDGAGNPQTTETRTVAVRERTETNLTVNYPAGTDGNGNVIFEGQLETANGDPISNQPVKLLDESGAFAPPNKLATARTDENGQFTIEWDAEQMGGDDVETWVAFENSSSEYAPSRYPDEQASRYYVQVEPSLQVFRPELVVTETATTVRQGNETTLFPIHYAAGGMETDPPADMPNTVTAVEGLPADAYSIQPSIEQLLTTFPLSTVRATGYAASVTVDAGELSPGTYDVTVFSATPYTEQSTKREVTLEVVPDDVDGARRVAYNSAARSISPTWWQNSAMVTVLRDTGIQDPVRYSLEKVKSMVKSLRSPKKAAITPLKILGETYVNRVVPLLGSVEKAQVGEVLARSAQRSGTDVTVLESRLATASDEIAAGEKAAGSDEIGATLANLREWQLTLKTMDTEHPSARETAVKQLESVEQFLLAEYRYLSEMAATVEAFDTPTGAVQAGETVESSVTVTNNGTTDDTFFVGYSAVGPSGETYDDSGQTGTLVSLAAGESTTVTVSWSVPDSAPTGGYDLVTAVWSKRPGDGDATQFDEARTGDAVRVTDTPDTGTLVVSTVSADAVVYVDGEVQGIGDQSLTLAAGEHTLRVTKPDFGSVERTVNVAAGETTTETVSLSPKPATLTVSSNVSAATVTVEGTEVGSAPVSVEQPPGEYEVVVRADGYQPATRTVSLSPNERESVSVNLEPASDTGNEPPEASVTANRTTVSVDAAMSLDASSSTDPDDPDSALSYDWTLVESPEGVDVSPFPNEEQSAVTFGAPGAYTFEVTVTDAAGSTDTDRVTVTVESTESENSPAVSEFRLLNPSEHRLEVRFNSPDSITDISVPVTAGGDPITTLTEADFTMSDGTYTAMFNPGTSGKYTATLERAANEHGDGASGQEAAVNTTKEEHDTGPVPSIPGIAAFENTTTLTSHQTIPNSLAGKITAESPVADDVNVTVVRASKNNYSVAITAPDNVTNVTFYLQTVAISASQNIEDLSMYIDNDEHGFRVVESAESGGAAWVAFNVPHFSTRTVTFTSNTSATNAPAITAPPDDSYYSDEDLILGVEFNASGVIASDDVAVTFTNTTTDNSTILATTFPNNETGTAQAVISSGDLFGNVTITTKLLNTTTGTVSTTDSVNLTATQPTSTFSDIDPSELPGSGTQVDPYEVSTASELQAIEDDLDAHYELVSDIDATNTTHWNNGSGFDPLGHNAYEESTDPPFTGSLNGNQHVVYGLTIDRPIASYVGLFGNAKATITNVTLHDVSITGQATVGGLSGRFESARVANVNVTGTVSGDASNIGGLIGYHYGGTLVNVSTTVAVAGDNRAGGIAGSNIDGEVHRAIATGSVTAGDNVGGLIGRNNGGTIDRSLATGTVNGTEWVGGLIGYNQYEDASVTNVYATGEVTGNRSVGGLVGEHDGTIEQAYATGHVTGTKSVGGLVGDVQIDDFLGGGTGTVLASYWDTTTSNQSTSAGNATGLTTVQMTGSPAGTNMTEFPFGDTWTLQPDSYPVLSWQPSTTTDQTPEAYAIIPSTAHNNTTITLDAGDSYDDGTITDYTWTITTPDETTTTQTGVNVTLTPTQLGNYTVTLSVTDNDGNTNTTKSSMTVLTSQRATTDFATAIESTNAPVTEGNALSITATITNTGNTTSRQTISLNVSGQTRDTQTVSLGPDNVTTVTLSWATTSGDAGDHRATISTENATASTSLRVANADSGTPTFDVTIPSSNSPVVEGDTLAVNATITNTGDGFGTQSVSLLVNNTEVATTEVSIGAGDSQTITLTWTTTSGDAGNHTATVSSVDTQAQHSVKVQTSEAALEVVDGTLTSNATTTRESVNVTAQVANTGTARGTMTATLYLNDTAVAHQSVTVGPGNTTTIRFSDVGAGRNSGTYDIRINNQSAGTLTIEEPVDESTSTGTPGFGLLPPLVSLILIFLHRRKK